MTPSLELALFVMFVGLLLAVAEVFIPSGHVLTILSAVALIGSLVIGFRTSATAGFIVCVCIVVMLPVLIGFGLWYWPRSPLGKRIFLPAPDRSETPSASEAAHLGLEDLEGQVGVTLTPQRPSGMTDFDGRRVDTVTEGGMIGKGQRVKVIEVAGNRVVVRQIEPDEDTLAT